MARKRKRRAQPLPWYVTLLAVAVLVAIFLFDRFGSDLLSPPQPDAPPGQTTDASGQIQAFFTTPTLVYPDRRDQRPASPLLNAVIRDVEAARERIDLAVFDFDIEPLAEALIAAKQRGVNVRLVIDSENLEAPEVAEVAGRMEQAAIPITFDQRSAFMHNKFIVIDEQVVWTGSWNMTTNDTYRNNNNMLRLTSRQVAADYGREFEQMFGGTFGPRKASAAPRPRQALGAASLSVFFSPQDGVAPHVLDQIAGAERSIRFMAFSFTSDEIAGAMVDKARAGVEVRGVFERQNVAGTGADFNLLLDGGVDVLEDGNCYIMHHKVIVIDERIVITGSYNFTRSAERDNDENLVIVDDAALARAYLDEFDRVYAQAQSPTRCG